MGEEGEDQRTSQRAVVLAREYARNLSEQEAHRLYRWARELLEIRNSDLSTVRKARAAFRATAHSEIARPLAAQLARHARELGISVKRHLWDERGWGARLGLAGITISSLTFGGQGAGIVALGGGIGVPLWLVIGAGGTFLGALVDELSPKPPVTTGVVIDVEKVSASSAPRPELTAGGEVRRRGVE